MPPKMKHKSNTGSAPGRHLLVKQKKKKTYLSKQQYMKSKAVMLSVLDDGRKLTSF
jgi:hypothetical protein